MQNNLLSIFNAITPDNIKGIKIIEDSMRIFIELIRENSPISSDIKIALSENTTDSISEELIKIYLYDYYSLINDIKKDKNIVNKFRVWNNLLKPNIYPVDLPIIGENLIINYFTIGEPTIKLSTNDGNLDEKFDLDPLSTKLGILQNNLLQNTAQNYFINRIFKQSKGMKKSIQFMYDVINEYLVSENERKNILIEETGTPFELNITGSIDKDIYDKSVAVYCHPLGFVCDYTYISELLFDDNYSVSKFYNINLLEVRCLSGGIDAYNKTVSNIIESTNYLKIIFDDGYYLLQDNGGVNYYNNLDYIVTAYPQSGNCAIFLDYTVEYRSNLSDDMYIQLSTDISVDSFNDINEAYSSVETFTMKPNFIIGLSTIGEDIITSDTDYISFELMQEEFSIESF